MFITSLHTHKSFVYVVAINEMCARSVGVQERCSTPAALL